MTAPEVTGPQYISSHSADVILSDIRPIKLKVDGLRSINVLLDEFLFNILNTARSLSTDKLRASLLSILPTSLGKEALLEAEVELRAYWERTPRPGPGEREDDGTTFNLQWAFELLRLKCEAYCTLNESDEDSTAVSKLQERMSQLGGTTPPASTLIAPASLYLTAILESVCEHILSNVGRVAARDSSRTSATVQDVFVALCEDHSIYELFKSMRVYQQIEQLTQTPKPRRSKSFSRNERSSLSRNSPSNQELVSSTTSGRESSTGHRSRNSTDITPTTTMSPSVSSNSRSSFDKARKKFTRSSNSNEDGTTNGHKRSDSVLSEDTKQTLAAYNSNSDSPEDSALEKEFDNLMRSGSTMKVSLTPDRLKTMEVYKQEKGKGARRPAPVDTSASVGPSTVSTTATPRANGRRPSIRPNAIEEDEEEASQPKSTPTRKNNNPSSSAPTSITSPPRKSSKATLAEPMPAPTPQRRQPGGGGPRGFDTDSGFPAKTRRIQKNRESLDLDDVMAGSDDELDDTSAPPLPQTPAKSMSATPSSTPGRMRSPSAVSKSTRELMDFLNEGPPDEPPRTHKLSAAGRDMVEFLNQGPPDFSNGITSSNGISSVENGKKGSGRLQRMMSKLSMSTSERGRSQPSEDFGRKAMSPTTPIRTTGPGLAHQTSYGNLANRPIPPRPPPVQPISPPASEGEDEFNSVRARKQSAPTTPRRENGTTPIKTNGYTSGGEDFRTRKPSVAGQSQSLRVVQPNQAPPPKASPTSPAPRQPLPAPPVAPIPIVAEDHAHDMRRMLAAATNADECRLIVEMFLSKSGVKSPATSPTDAYPSPSASDSLHQQQLNSLAPSPDGLMELALVELFLGGERLEGSITKPIVSASSQQIAPRKPLRSKKRPDGPASSSPLPATPTTPVYTSPSAAPYTPAGHGVVAEVGA
ncbi:hypothetical protein MIND_00786100 [Mycena indigotica]|uniref:Uncharacterized protein n=1 Tax=Mycena indigotica TaxID=2126181 RepID=A0A8H6W248_9AGAR|nr:uncharacterized protein MIND_00786100 [Mycena indigotica]KAF7302192.1 hypothetical protein MIND_00786100 [Mycena indigotica]